MEWVVAIVVLLLIRAMLKPRRCDVCGERFKRKYYAWKLEGKKQHLCPYCSGKLSRRKSDQRFKDRFG